jgi:hypothetical protein
MLPSPQETNLTTKSKPASLLLTVLRSEVGDDFIDA